MGQPCPGFYQTEHYGGMGAPGVLGAQNSYPAGLFQSVNNQPGSIQGYNTRDGHLALQQQQFNIQPASIKNKEHKKMGFIKEYFTKHKELFMGLAVAMVLDRYLFDGAFQEKIKKIVHNLLDKTEEMLKLDHKA
jgi:hypothetical protein